MPLSRQRRQQTQYKHDSSSAVLKDEIPKRIPSPNNHYHPSFPSFDHSSRAKLTTGRGRRGGKRRIMFSRDTYGNTLCFKLKVGYTCIDLSHRQTPYIENSYTCPLRLL